MVIQTSEVINRLRTKINSLKTLYEGLKSEKSNLNNELNQIKETLKEKEYKILELQEQINTLKLANALVGGRDTHDAKVKINRIVREIDKCIALLNR
jgi:archaellum component FlaC